MAVKKKTSAVRDQTPATSGWGFTKLPTAQRTEPKLHYFDDLRSLCHGTAPAKGQVLTASTANWPRERTCNACIGKKRALAATAPRTSDVKVIRHSTGTSIAFDLPNGIKARFTVPRGSTSEVLTNFFAIGFAAIKEAVGEEEARAISDDLLRALNEMKGAK